ncbi:Metaxin-2 [Acropora cervicornis]|uniref:Metaxin-2 n=1 Tax=Acropora cervicornis TaxID=6130 RepID=A0AAD9QHA6_ACRCE|nr:Metaxin-2 [Acropora cervicornis]
MAARGPVEEAVIAAMSVEQGVWPESVELYEPRKDAALCRSTEAYLRFCGLAHEVKSRRNAEFMSPTGNVPFLRAKEELVCDFSGITAYIESKASTVSPSHTLGGESLGFSTSQDFEVKDRASLRAYLSLVENSLYPAELYMLWWKKDWAARTRQHYGSQFSAPLNLILSYKKQWKVLKEFQQTCQALSEKLGKNRFFINDRPTELDALVFGHLHSVLTRYLPDNSLSSIIKEYKNLEDFVMTILREYFH